MSKDRLVATKFNVGQIVAAMHALDLVALREAIAQNPGPRYYVEIERATLEYAEQLLAIETKLGSQRGPVVAELAKAINGGPLQ